MEGEPVDGGSPTRDGTRRGSAHRPAASAMPTDAIASVELRRAYERHAAAAGAENQSLATSGGIALPLSGGDATVDLALPMVEPRPIDNDSEPCLICYDPVTAESPEAEIAQMVSEAMSRPDALCDSEELSASASGALQVEAASGCGSAVPTISARSGPATSYCAHGCGRNYHAACIRRWAFARGALQSVPCPACRAPWRSDDPCLPSTAAFAGPEEGTTTEDGAALNEGFLNLGGLLPTTARARDTSTYSEWLQVHQQRREQREMVLGPSAVMGRSPKSAEGMPPLSGGRGGGDPKPGSARVRSGSRMQGGAISKAESCPSAAIMSGWLRRSKGGG